VTCTATDAKQRAASCSFPVTVKAPVQQTISLTKFLAFGDSITWGEDGRNSTSDPTVVRIRPQLLVDTPYPTALYGDLVAAYPTQASAISVANQGCKGELAGGTTSPCDPAGTLDRFTTLVSTGTYQAVLLLEGANDLGDLTSETAGLNGLRLMVEAAKARNVRPYLSTLLPENPNAVGPPLGRGGNADRVPGFNAQIAALAQLENITLVDANAGFSLSLIAPDGLHPTQAGYFQLAQIFFNSLKATLQQTATTTSLTMRLTR
jgi:lysophospholipase L1-like esterase